MGSTHEGTWLSTSAGDLLVDAPPRDDGADVVDRPTGPVRDTASGIEGSARLQEGEPGGDEPDGDEPGGNEPATTAGEEGGAERADWLTRLVDVGVVAVCMIFVWLQLHPHLLLNNTTPSGGDMGAHVWGPAYLRDHLLPHFRLSGWTPDWYAGFPAYTYYMVVPALAVVGLDLVLPYGVAFKLVAVSGVVFFPLAAYALGRLFRLRFPGPALLAVFTLPFLFDTTFTIYGGNIASTLAGEFAFSISLTLLLLYLGFLSRGLETGRHRAITAVLFALVAVCHPLPLLGMASVATLAVVGWHVVVALGNPERLRVLRSTGWWLVSSLGTGALLSAFWIAPFLLRGAYLNDMGWERLPSDGGRLLQYLFHAGSDTRALSGWERLSAMPALWFMCLVLAAVGTVLSWVYREKLGCILSLTAVGEVAIFCFIPQGRFWNARVLPFWYLSIYLLAAVGVALLTRLLRSVPARTAVALGTFAAVLVGVALPLGVLAGSTKEADGRWHFLGMSSKESFVKSWAKWNFSGYEGKTAYPEYYDVVTKMQQVGQQNGCGRTLWEYDNDRLNSYGTPMSLMLLPYWTNGCIGSMEGLFFEASASTPYHFLMQSELSSRPSRPQRNLPYRDLDVDLGVQQLQLYGVRYYMAFSNRAVTEARANPALTEVAQVGGNPQLLAQLKASSNPDAAAVDRASPWVVFEVADSDLVTPLNYEPVVTTGIGQHQHDWLEPAEEYFGDPSRWDVVPATTGPSNWPRTEDLSGELPRTPVTPAVIDDIHTSDDSISFTVDEQSIGSPVLVKASYFPNWQAKGAHGPYRVMPNLMVVVPTSTKVTLHYGYTPIDYLAWGLTLLGLAALVILVVRPALRLAGAGRVRRDDPRRAGGADGPRDPTGGDGLAAWAVGTAGGALDGRSPGAPFDGPAGMPAGPPPEDDLPPPSSKDWMAAERDPSLGWLWAVPDRPLSAADGVFGLDGADGADGTDSHVLSPAPSTTPAPSPSAPAVPAEPAEPVPGVTSSGAPAAGTGFDPDTIPQTVHWTDRDEVHGADA